MRDYIWKICSHGADAQKAATADPAINKKNALVALYRLWSAFTKNIRYIIDKKGKSVTLARFGTFTRSQQDPQTVIFIASSDVAAALSAQRSNEESHSETTGPEWGKIAPAAQIPTQEIARLFITAVIMMAMQKAKRGQEVSLSFKVGKLTLG